MFEQDRLALEQWPLAEIDYACQRETARYRRHEPSDTRFCLELFRRALIYDGGNPPLRIDEEAGEILTRTYTEFIKAHINRAAVQASSTDDIVQQVWLRFWRAAGSGLSFPTLEQALAYIKLVTITAVIHEQRRVRNLWRIESLEQRIGETGEEALAETVSEPFSAHVRQRFRERCRELIVDGQQWQVFWWKYGLGLQPREIASLLERAGTQIKNRPPTARAVSDMLDRIFRKLEADAEIQDLLGSD
ncbi:hypothetical protein SE17_13155 [Kouleothrix aurantiaca]|uniref:Uncharacterized protein n=1 Tax=Kouleothrix aurantiaca TaxID=186479 RepID=A0A0N8PSI6_9CHLR|nr:hypothetical protein SE17_13155 [Kouleothrix aurantiaca]